MTSRRSEQRTLRKTELTVESLSTRIVPAGFHHGSLIVAGMHGHFENGGGTTGKPVSPKHLDGNLLVDGGTGHGVKLNIQIFNQHSRNLNKHSNLLGSPAVLKLNPPANFVSTTTTTNQQNNQQVVWQARELTTTDPSPNPILSTDQHNSQLVTWQARDLTPDPSPNPFSSTDQQNNQLVTSPAPTTDPSPNPILSTDQHNSQLVTWLAR